MKIFEFLSKERLETEKQMKIDKEKLEKTELEDDKKLKDGKITKENLILEKKQRLENEKKKKFLEDESKKKNSIKLCDEIYEKLKNCDDYSFSLISRFCIYLNRNDLALIFLNHLIKKDVEDREQGQILNVFLELKEYGSALDISIESGDDDLIDVVVSIMEKKLKKEIFFKYLFEEKYITARLKYQNYNFLMDEKKFKDYLNIFEEKNIKDIAFENLKFNFFNPETLEKRKPYFSYSSNIFLNLKDETLENLCVFQVWLEGKRINFLFNYLIF